MSKIGILGGTFDPPHLAHIAIAQAARAQLELDEVILVPAGRSPFKLAENMSLAKHRLKMTELAIDEEEGLSVSDIEITRAGPSFTVDTLVELHMAQPADYWLILGSDQLKAFVDWKGPHRILQMARLAAVVRPPDTRDKLEVLLADWMTSKVDYVELEPSPISSTQLRSMIKHGQPIDKWVKPSVKAYVDQERLYRGSK